MKKHQPNVNQYTEISTLSHEGRGITDINGKKTFLFGGLPNEAVNFHYLKTHRKYDEGKVITVIQAAANRVNPQCKHFGVCGGCSLQHLAHNAQIQHKQKVLLEQLLHIGNIIPEQVLPPLLGPLWGYRHKARLGVRYVKQKNKVLVGFRELNGRYLADIECCEILYPAVGTRITDLSELLQKLDSYEHIPQIEVAVGDNTVALIFRHLQPLTENDHNQLKLFSQQHNFHCYLQPGGVDSINKLWPENNEQFLSYQLPQENLTLHFHPQDFTQINPTINQQLIQQALTLLAPSHNEKVLDLFCGIGNFTLPLARHCQQVTGIEGDNNLVQRAQANAKLNTITNADFYCADLSQPTITAHWATQRFDKILLDPPRTGASELMQQLPKFNASRIVYVSCNPATLARDAGQLVKFGYTLTHTGIMDMFPHTSHVESIALFEYKNNSSNQPCVEAKLR